MQNLTQHLEKKIAVYDEFWWRKSRNTERDIYPGRPDISFQI